MPRYSRVEAEILKPGLVWLPCLYNKKHIDLPLPSIGRKVFVVQVLA